MVDSNHHVKVKVGWVECNETHHCEMARLRVCFDAIHKLAHGVGVKVGWVKCNETHHPKMRVKRKRLA